MCVHVCEYGGRERIISTITISKQLDKIPGTAFKLLDWHGLIFSSGQ